MTTTKLFNWFSLGKVVVGGAFLAGMWLGGLTWQVNALAADNEQVKEDIRIIRDAQIALVCKLVPDKCPIKVGQ